MSAPEKARRYELSAAGIVSEFARLNCGHTYWDVHETDPPPDVEALAFVTPADAQALLSVVVPVRRLPRDHARRKPHDL